MLRLNWVIPVYLDIVTKSKISMSKFRIFKSLIIVKICLFGIETNSADSGIDSPVTLERAFAIAVENEPRLKANEHIAEAADGQIIQGGLRPNPVIGAEVENFLGTGPFSGAAGLEITLGVRQPFETADKGEKRARVAEGKRKLVDWERERILVSLKSEVRQLFVEVLLAQKEQRLRQQLLEITEHSREETARLVEAAQAPEVELSRAKLAVQRQQFSLMKANRRLGTAKQELASLWGFTPAPEFTVRGNISLAEELPELTQLLGRLPDTAELARFETRKKLREAELDLEEARAVGDFELFGGVRYTNEGRGDGSFVVGIDIPWKLFDQNQGNLQSARARRNAVDPQLESARRNLSRRLVSAYNQLKTAYQEAKSAKTELLPSAEATLEATEKGYEQGIYTLVNVLESRQALFEVREIYLEALQRYAQAQAVIKSITEAANINS